MFKVKTFFFIKIILSLLLIGCGSGGGSISKDDGPLSPSNPDNGSDNTIVITLSTTDLEGNDSSEVSNEIPIRVNASVIATSGAAQANTVVTFTIDDPDLASFSPESGTALTDSSGHAFIDLYVGSKEGAGTITATINSGETNTIGVRSKGDAPEDTSGETLKLELKLYNNENPPEQASDLSRLTPLNAVAVLTDSSGNPLEGRLVSFSVNNGNLAQLIPTTGTALTNPQGVASVSLLVGTVDGAGIVEAQVTSNNQTYVKTKGFTSAGDGGADAAKVSSFVLYTNRLFLPSSGSDQAQLTAIVKDENNILLEGVEVQFGATSGQLEVSKSLTENDGQAIAALATLNEPELRTITVTATAGGLQRTIDIDVTGTSIDVNGPSSMVLGDTSELVIFLHDSDNNGIPLQEIIINSTNGNLLSREVVTTDLTGRAEITLNANVTGADVITATALNATGTLNFSVLADAFAFADDNKTTIDLNTPTTISLSWFKDGVPLPNADVSFSSSRGIITSGENTTTDANGIATFTVEADNAGPAVFTAIGHPENGEDIFTNLRVEFVSSSADVISLQASPNSVGPDGDKSTLIAVVKDSKGNLVKGKRVRFSVDDSSGGFIEPSTDVTDSSGTATSVYTSNAVTPRDGVVVTATVDGETPAVSAQTHLTVADRELFISLGTGSAVGEDTTSFIKSFVAFVVDANGNPVENVELQVSALPRHVGLDADNKLTAYTKGFWVAEFRGLDFHHWFPRFTVNCDSEDLDQDGVLDAGEDINGDGLLTPGGVAVAETDLVTDANGMAIFTVSYPKNYAPWVVVDIDVTAPVFGTESIAKMDFRLAYGGLYVLVENAPPLDSPFGTGNVSFADGDTSRVYLFNGDLEDTLPAIVYKDGEPPVCTNTL